MYQHSIHNIIQGAGITVDKTNNYSGSMLTGLDETIPANGSTTFSNFDVDVSEVISVFMLCDRDITLKINDDGTPDATINLWAGKPLYWTEDAYFSNPLGSVDCTSLKATLAAGEDASLQIEVIQDAIP